VETQFIHLLVAQEQLLFNLMAHYAFLDSNNIVTEVIVGKDEADTSHDWEQYYGAFRGQTCKRTSYHGNIRKNYAGIGYIYDASRDAFISKKPYASWILNETTCRWDAPIPMPHDGKFYSWNEEQLVWVES
jgi:hypothetical protein